MSRGLRKQKFIRHDWMDRSPPLCGAFVEQRLDAWRPEFAAVLRLLDVVMIAFPHASTAFSSPEMPGLLLHVSFPPRLLQRALFGARATWPSMA
jgi:hypothetical protein